MKRWIENSPVAIRLGLRDLGNNKIATGVLIAVIALVLSFALPGAIISNSRTIVERVAMYTNFDQRFPTPQDETLRAEAVLDHAGPRNAELFTEAGLTPLSIQARSVEFLESRYIPDECLPVPDAELIAESGKEFCEAHEATLIADWNVPQLAAQMQVVGGRLPANDQEIALPFEDGYTFLGFDTSIGDTIQVEALGGPKSLTVVGYIDSTFRPTGSALHDSVRLPESLCDNEHDLIMFGFGPDLTSAQAQTLAAGFTDPARTYVQSWDSWKIRQFAEDKSSLVNAASVNTATEFGTDSITTFGPAALFGALALVTLLSVPLYWQSQKRRAAQLELLEVEGMKPRTIFLSRLIPASVVGVSGGLLSFIALSSGLMNFMFENFWGAFGFRHTPQTLWFSFAAAIVCGVVPLAIASALSSFGLARSKNAESVFTPVTRKKARSRTLTGVALVAAGLAYALFSAAVPYTQSASTIGLPGIAMGLVVALVGSYVFLASVLALVSLKSEGWRPSARIAANELMFNRRSAVNIAVPVAVIAAIGSVFSVIGIQHDSESNREGYVALYAGISVVLCLIILMILLLSNRKSAEEQEAISSALLAHGLFDREISSIAGWRTLILAATSTLTGYVVGTATGAILMIYRANTDLFGFAPQSMLPSIITIIVVVVPIAMSFALGKFSSGRAAPQVAAPA